MATSSRHQNKATPPPEDTDAHRRRYVRFVLLGGASLYVLVVVVSMMMGESFVDALGIDQVLAAVLGCALLAMAVRTWGRLVSRKTATREDVGDAPP